MHAWSLKNGTGLQASTRPARDDAATCMLQGGFFWGFETHAFRQKNGNGMQAIARPARETQSSGMEKRAIEPVALSPKW